jgi:starch phosphorylase
MYPERFGNITNGVTPRRFVALSNPGLAALLTRHLGDGWIRNLDELRALEALAGDGSFAAAWREVKRLNKVCLAQFLSDRTGISVDPQMLFDIQVKRIHEYKRQHLNVLHILTLYRRLKADPDADLPARLFLFGGKAAPGYRMAKLMVKLITSVADVVNGDPDVRGRLTVVFLPDFNVKNAQLIYPAADLSEQISTAGKEASGTGNMKFAMNGALTIGTLDGANVEIREAVGAEHFFLFGLTASEVRERKQQGYRSRDVYESNAELRGVIDHIASGALGGGDGTLFQPIVDQLLGDDPYMLLADYASYVAAQEAVSARWRDQEQWTRDAVLNVARMGHFSSDRSIREYCEKVWNVEVGRP